MTRCSRTSSCSTFSKRPATSSLRSPEAPTLLAGAGWMAREYLKVFRELGLPVEVVGRDPARAQAVAADFAVPARGGGSENAAAVSGYRGVIVATGVRELAAATIAALDAGARHVLV